MLQEVQSAIEDAVLQAKSNGVVLEVEEAVRQIAAAHGVTGDDARDQIARAVLKEAARRGVAMQFTQ